MNGENKELGKKLWKDFVQRDLIYLTLIALAVAGCLYTLIQDQNCAEKCEQFIQKQLKNSACLQKEQTPETLHHIFLENWEDLKIGNKSFNQNA